MKTRVTPVALSILVLLVVGCEDTLLDANKPSFDELDNHQGMVLQSNNVFLDANLVKGRTIQPINFEGQDSGMFSGRITGLTFVWAAPDRPIPLVGMRGRLVGWLTDNEGARYRINGEFYWEAFAIYQGQRESLPITLSLEDFRGGVFSQVFFNQHGIDADTFIPPSVDVLIQGGRGSSQMIGRELLTVLTDPQFHD